ncbi:MAG: ATP-binding cassette domain-containing protein [Rhodospirillales bacterium]|nr:ATP-binding cassette domain-containing protein [Rhodospirillales bacterium]
MTPKAEIRIEGLSKSFQDVSVLKGIDLTIYQGEMIAIVGYSGCGKTVLLDHILGRLEPDTGSVMVADHGHEGSPLVDLHDLGAMDADTIHVHWGVVFQRNALFSGSVLDNIALWLREIRNASEYEIRTIAQDVLKAVGLPTDDDFLDRDINELSGGMAKRLAVARALSMDPRVIFYDEPTTGLDPANAAQIHDLITRTHDRIGGDGGSATTVIITHDRDLLFRLNPRIIMLHEGRVFFDGSIDAFESSDSEVIRPYFSLMHELHRSRAEPHDSLAAAGS